MDWIIEIGRYFLKKCVQNCSMFRAILFQRKNKGKKLTKWGNPGDGGNSGTKKMTDQLLELPLAIKITTMDLNLYLILVVKTFL